MNKYVANNDIVLLLVRMQMDISVACGSMELECRILENGPAVQNMILWTLKLQLLHRFNWRYLYSFRFLVFLPKKV